jgi:hypothetical protein
VRRELDDRAGLGLERVRTVVVHQAGVVEQAVLGDERRRAPGRLPHRRPVAARLDAEAVERRERPLEVLPLLVLR